MNQGGREKEGNITRRDMLKGAVPGAMAGLGVGVFAGSKIEQEIDSMVMSPTKEEQDRTERDVIKIGSVLIDHPGVKQTLVEGGSVTIELKRNPGFQALVAVGHFYDKHGKERPAFKGGVVLG